MPTYKTCIHIIVILTLKTKTYAFSSKIKQIANPPITSNILYKKSILPPHEFDQIKKDLFKANNKLKLPLKNEHKSSIAKLRKGIRLSNDSKTVEILTNPNGAIAKLIAKYCDDDDNGSMVFRRDIPVELRTYETAGACMDWHVDDVLYTPHPQIEIIFTVFNTSNCKTMYKNKQDDDDGKSDDVDVLYEVETESNSVLLIPAGGALHKVTPLKYGKRIIVKFVYNFEYCELLDGLGDVGQFGKIKRR